MPQCFATFSLKKHLHRDRPKPVQAHLTSRNRYQTRSVTFSINTPMGQRQQQDRERETAYAAIGPSGRDIQSSHPLPSSSSFPVLYLPDWFPQIELPSQAVVGSPRPYQGQGQAKAIPQALDYLSRPQQETQHWPALEVVEPMPAGYRPDLAPEAASLIPVPVLFDCAHPPTPQEPAAQLTQLAQLFETVAADSSARPVIQSQPALGFSKNESVVSSPLLPSSIASSVWNSPVVSVPAGSPVVPPAFISPSQLFPVSSTGRDWSAGAFSPSPPADTDTDIDIDEEEEGQFSPEPDSEREQETVSEIDDAQAEEESDNIANETLLSLPPAYITHPTLQPRSPDFVEFLRRWFETGRQDLNNSPNRKLKVVIPRGSEIVNCVTRPKGGLVTYEDLAGEEGDMQAINWTKMRVSRSQARVKRFQTYVHRTSVEHGHVWKPGYVDVKLPQVNGCFRFHKMLLRQNVRQVHAELSHLLALPTRTWAYYPNLRGMQRLNTISGVSEAVVDLDMFVTSACAGNGVLAVCGLRGRYAFTRLDAEPGTVPSEGIVNSNETAMTHVQVYMPRRSWSPVVAFSSNCHSVYMMDVATETIIQSTMTVFRVHGSSVSPDGRLRLIVGESRDAIVANAETSEYVQILTGHRDSLFACDWSDDGWHVATASTDKTVRIWDARRWSLNSGEPSPLITIRSELACVRTLQFSPTGSGRPVLAACEEADFLHLIDVPTLASRQTFDFFGHVAGLRFADEGRDLNVLISDRFRGGLLQFTRCGAGSQLDAFDARSHLVRRHGRRPLSGAYLAESNGSFTRQLSHMDTVEPF